jgi:hypothetical protein
MWRHFEHLHLLGKISLNHLPTPKKKKNVLFSLDLQYNYFYNNKTLIMYH